MSTDRLFDEGAGLFEINPSKLGCYLDCPRQYRFRYVDGRRERRSFAPASIGRSVHKALRDFYALAPEERTLDSLLRALRRSWDRTGFRSAQHAEDAFSRAEGMLRTYHENTRADRVRAVALESKFTHASSSDGVLVTGRIDRLDIDEDEYVVVDYKTGRFGADADIVDASLPLSLYAFATSAVLGRQVGRIAVEHLPTGRRVETRRDADRLAGDWKAVVDIVDEMRTGEEFPPAPGPLCRWCDYLQACPEGRRHVGRRR